MCGIFFVQNRDQTIENFKNSENIKHRGPDNTQEFTKSNFDDSGINLYFKFHRLSINDTSENGNQPFRNSDCILTCNGEIYNMKKLIIDHNLENLESNSDCEVIIPLYRKYGFESMLNLLDGVFSIVLYDCKNYTTYVACDRVGVRPLFYQIDFVKGFFSCCSEAKGLDFEKGRIKQLGGGKFIEYRMYRQELDYKKREYYSFDDVQQSQGVFEILCKGIENRLVNAVEKRLMSDREIGCFLSGGVDSSIICAIMAKIYKQKGKKLKTYSVGFSSSTDLVYARKVADHIGSEHTEIILDINKVLDRLRDVVYATETFDITTIRASMGMYLLSEFISKNSEEVVILSGEGADEVFGGYLYFHDAPNAESFDKECKWLIKQLPYFDVLRADRCTANHGLELRVPFLDYSFIEYVHGIPSEYRQACKGYEKYILRKAFSDYLPTEIIWRRKEGFSDGVGGLTPWYSHFQDYADKSIGDNEFERLQSECYINLPNKEAGLYYKIFKTIFGGEFKCIPFYWMPKWQSKDLKDPSGRKVKAWDINL